MLVHYLKIAFRNLWKYKTQSVISIIGLALGFTCFSLAILWMRHEKSYDSFYKDTERIYLIRKTDGMTSSYSQGVNRSIIPDALPDYLTQHFPEVEKRTAFNFTGQKNTEVKHNDHVFKVNSLYVDNSFTDLFGLEVIEGDFLFLQNAPGNEIALFENHAKKLFGKESALGKTVIINERSEHTVAAVIKDPEGPSNFPFDILMKKDESNGNEWSLSSEVCFVKLHPNVNIETFKEKIGNINVYVEIQNFGSVEQTYSFEIVPIAKVRSDFPFTVPDVEQNHILLFALSGIMVIACSLFNFFTLFVSRFRIRQKEFAIRFVNGSSLGSLFLLLISEFFVVLLLALLLGIAFIKTLLPSFSILSQVQAELSSIYGESLLYIAGIIIVALLAFYICLVIFHKRSLSASIRKSNNHLFRKISIALQLVISIGFIFCTVVLQKQLRYLHTVNIGFNYKNMEQ